MKEYRTIQGDTWDMIAKNVYGDEKHLDYLMQNNFPLLEYLIFPAGIALKTPELEKREELSLPAWRK